MMAKFNFPRNLQDYKDILGKLKFEGPYGLSSILDHK